MDSCGYYILLYVNRARIVARWIIIAIETANLGGFMFRLVTRILLLGCLVSGIFLFLLVPRVLARQKGQIPTVSIPTVTSSPSGAMATVTREQDQINVRGGPGVEYPIIGVLIAGQQIPALGRSVGGQWVLVAYPGASEGIAWVYSPLVEIVGSLPVVAPPPTPTPRTTPTIDPTLAAQFIVEIPPTRLPTFTPPPPLLIPTFPVETVTTASGRVPMGLIIIGMSVIGVFGLLISILRGR
jgi:hypothetical protein